MGMTTNDIREKQKFILTEKIEGDNYSGGEWMNVFEELMSQRWIVKSLDREKYYRVLDEEGTIRDFVTEKLGYRLLVNGSLVKLEKIPGEALAWMGIQEFRDPKEYAVFCCILMFLEDKESEEQFVLSQLTEYISAQFPEGEIPWTVYANRQMLIRIIKYCIKNQLFLVDDGKAEDFAVDMSTEALYENTGLSKYFMRNFAMDISNRNTPEDFFQSEWFDMNEDRGIIRRQRVYRKLLLSLGMYREKEQDEDFNYVKNYRYVIENDLSKLLDCSLQIHKSSAYLVLHENGYLGKAYPPENSIALAILLLQNDIVTDVGIGQLKPEVNETITMTSIELHHYISKVRKNYGAALTKSIREMSEPEFITTIIDQMLALDLIRLIERSDEYMLMPIVGKLVGKYQEIIEEKKE